VKVGVRRDRVAENRVANGVKAGLRVKAVRHAKVAGQRGVVKDVRRVDRARVVRAAIAVRGRAADVSISPRISISRS
jgi:hypothetical protein